MNTTTSQYGKELAKLPVARMQDVLLARLIARQEGMRMGFPAQALTQIATAVSEITRNVVQYAGRPGQIRMFELREASRAGLKFAVEDQGVGIGDIERTLTANTPGAGIPGSRILMDEFAIESTPGSGTTVIMAKWLPVSS